VVYLWVVGLDRIRLLGIVTCSMNKQNE